MRLPALLAAALLCAAPAHALLVRPDRDDAEYLELATHYPSSVRLEAAGGDAVLIAPRWLLTAAHRARALDTLKARPPLQVGGKPYEIQSIHLHPQWHPGAANDIALILLREPVQGLEPTPIHREPNEAGKGVVIVGHGDTGRIGAQPQAGSPGDRRKRAAINTVDRVAPGTLGLRIKPADDASDLQGAATDSDSGGPAYLETDAGLAVAGIFNAPEGEWQRYARVSSHAPWIDETMFRAATQEAAAATARTR
jgi:hypothetical protein